MKDVTAFIAALAFASLSIACFSFMFGRVVENDDAPIGMSCTLGIITALTSIGFLVTAFPGH